MYKELCLFDIFYEGEVMAFDDAFCQSLTPLLNDKLSEYLLKFISDAHSSGVMSDSTYIAELIRDGISCLERNTVPRARVLTMHRDMHNKTFKGSSLFDYIRTMNLTGLDPLSLSSQEMQEISNTISEVLELIPAMVERVEARQKKDYLVFYSHVNRISQLAWSQRSQLESQGYGDLVVYNPKNVALVCDKNQELFFAHNEAARTTHLHRIISKEQDLRSIRQGLQYITMCDKASVSLNARRKI